MILDLFAGPGGWEQALLDVGWDDTLGIEFDWHACQTARGAGHQRLQADVASLDPWTVVGDEPLDGLVASPPCQGFSAAGKGRGRDDMEHVLEAAWLLGQNVPARPLLGALDALCTDHRTSLVLEPLRWVLALDPPWVAWEQVPTVLPLWETCRDILVEYGYYAWAGNLNAEQYGVPQTRKRAVLVAAKWPVNPPLPTHSRFYRMEPDRVDAQVPKWVSMAQALGWGATDRPAPTVTGGGTASGGAEPFGNGARQALAKAEAAGKWVMRSQYSNNGNQSQRGERTLDQPAATITGKPPAWVNPASPTASKRISVPEAAVLQTFPAEYPWQGFQNHQYQQVGNAVPPRLGAAVIRPVMAAAVAP